MARDILTALNLARHLQVKTQHDRWERLFHFSRDAIMLALKDFRTFTQDDYVATILEHQRSVFRHKRLALDYPDLYEQFLEVVPVRQLLVTGPAVPTDTEPPPKDALEHGPVGPRLQSVSPKGYIRSLIEQQFGPDEELLDLLEGSAGLKKKTG
jgi:hypothetical protein